MVKFIFTILFDFPMAMCLTLICAHAWNANLEYKISTMHTGINGKKNCIWLFSYSILLPTMMFVRQRNLDIKKIKADKEYVQVRQHTRERGCTRGQDRAVPNQEIK